MTALVGFIQQQPHFSGDFIQTAMGNILRMIRDDIGTARNIVVDIRNAFDYVFGDIIKPTLDNLNQLYSALAYLNITTNRLPNGKHGFHRLPIIFDPKYLIEVKDMIQTLIAFLDALLTRKVPGNITSIDDNVLEYIPIRLWQSSNRSQDCDHLIIREFMGYRQLLESIDDVLENQWADSNRMVVGEMEWPHALKNSVWARYKSIDTMISCVAELYTIIEKGHKEVSELYTQIDDAVRTNAVFRPRSLQETMKFELIEIEVKLLFFRNLITNYARNLINKQDFYRSVVNGNSEDSLKATIDSMLSKVDMDIIMKLQVQSQGMKNNVQNWMLLMLRIIRSLINYYEVESIENKIRSMAIWRKPAPALCTPNTWCTNSKIRRRGVYGPCM